MHLPERLAEFSPALAASTNATPRGYKPRQLLRHVGEGQDEVLLVQSGIVCQVRTALPGQRHIIALRYPGEAIFPHERRAGTAVEGLTASEILSVSSEAFDRARDERNDVARGYVELMQRNELIAYEWLVRDRDDSTSRIVHAICETAYRLGADLGRGFELPFTQAMFGEITAQTPVNVNRVMRDLADRGLVSYSRNFIAGDEPELRRAARFDESYLR